MPTMPIIYQSAYGEHALEMFDLFLCHKTTREGTIQSRHYKRMPQSALTSTFGCVIDNARRFVSAVYKSMARVPPNSGFFITQKQSIYRLMRFVYSTLLLCLFLPATAIAEDIAWLCEGADYEKLAEQFKQIVTPSSDTCIAEVNMDGQPPLEAAFYEVSSIVCGSKGCPFEVFHKKQGKWQEILDIITSTESIRLGPVQADQLRTVYFRVNGDDCTVWQYDALKGNYRITSDKPVRCPQ